MTTSIIEVYDTKELYGVTVCQSITMQMYH